jgi:hypothetical protein
VSSARHCVSSSRPGGYKSSKGKNSHDSSLTINMYFFYF